jgi:hypothetical protein
MEIGFEITSRGSMLIKFGHRVTTISGELTFEPPIFYADFNSFGNWEAPYQAESVNDQQKKEIIEYLSNQKGPTKIVFA